MTCSYPGCDKPATCMNEGGFWCVHPHPRDIQGDTQ